MDWYDLTDAAHGRSLKLDGQLSSLATERERELAALWRLEADVNNGAYVQFIANWGREAYEYASRALKKIGALRMAAIVDECQSLIDEHYKSEYDYDELLAKLPSDVAERVGALSYDFMDYPDDLATLGLQHYAQE